MLSQDTKNYPKPVNESYFWIYNLTKSSLLLTILFHAAINTADFFLPRSFPMLFVACTLAAIIVAIKERMWERLKKPAT